MKKQICLAIDTASDITSVAIMTSTGQFADTQLPLLHGQGEMLFSLIQDVFQQLNLSPKDLTLVAVAVGPGSFTGVRIGLATARALGLALHIPVVGVNNFIATACFSERPVTVVLDTKRDDYFVQSFDAEGQPLTDPKIQNVRQLKKELPFAAIGSGAKNLALELDIPVLSISKSLALSIAKIALFDPSKTVAPHPLYLRDADVTV